MGERGFVGTKCLRCLRSPCRVSWNQSCVARGALAVNSSFLKRNVYVQLLMNFEEILRSSKRIRKAIVLRKICEEMHKKLELLSFCT